MSTYYQFRCDDCKQQGGFFSRQMWGWGNCDIFENFKFVVAHAHCASGLEVLAEYDDACYDHAEELRWLEHLDADEDLRDSAWPHASEWADVADGWEAAHAKWRKGFDERIKRERARASRPQDGGASE